MYIDTDGDGNTDIVSRTNEYLKASSTESIKDLPTYLAIMRDTIISLKLPILAEKTWLRRIDQIIKTPEPYRNVERYVKRLSKTRLKYTKINDEQRVALLKIFDNLLHWIESKN
jgi:predicted neuraminidase